MPYLINNEHLLKTCNMCLYSSRSNSRIISSSKQIFICIYLSLHSLTFQRTLTLIIPFKIICSNLKHKFKAVIKDVIELWLWVNKEQRNNWTFRKVGRAFVSVIHLPGGGHEERMFRSRDSCERNALCYHGAWASPFPRRVPRD